MPNKTDLSLEEIRPILAAFDLRPFVVEPIPKGTINSNFSVTTNGGRVFLRVNECKREADVRYEGALLWHLGAHRLPTPQPLRRTSGEPFYVWTAPDGERRFITVFSWSEGAELADSAVKSRHASRVGEILARIHDGAADFKHKRPGIYTVERIIGRVEAMRERAADIADLSEAMPALEAEVEFFRGRSPRLPEGTIHGDLFPDNMLWQNDMVSAVLDFEQASRGRYAYDLAVTLLAFCCPSGRETLDDTLAWALVAGYQRVRQLSDEELEELWVEARLAAFRFTVTRITDVYLPSLPPTSIPAPPNKDFRTYLARLNKLRDAGPTGLDAITNSRPPLKAV